MHITIKFYGNLKQYLPHRQEVAPLEVEPGTTILDLLTRLGVPDEQVWMSAINDVVVPSSAALGEGDVLEVFEPVGGGAREPSGEH